MDRRIERAAQETFFDGQNMTPQSQGVAVDSWGGLEETLSGKGSGAGSAGWATIEARANRGAGGVVFEFPPFSLFSATLGTGSWRSGEWEFKDG